MSVVRCPLCGEVITNAIERCYCGEDDSYSWETSEWDEAGDCDEDMRVDDNDYLDENPEE